MLSRKVLLIGLISILVGTLATSKVLGQSEETIITIAIPDWMNNTIFTHELFRDFEAEYSDVKVVIVASGEAAYVPPAEYALDRHLDMTETYVSTADVLYVENYNLSVEATRAGFYLDLTPLVMADTTLDEADFYPPVWQSWQWDDGFWALPVAVSPQILIYDEAAFDEAALAYPAPSWTLDDLLQAASALTQRNAEGAMVVPGFVPEYFGELARGVLGEGFYDDTVLPNPPAFARPEVTALLDRWYTWLQKDSGGQDTPIQYAYDQVPMAIDNVAIHEAVYAESDARWSASLLPGGTAALRLQGFAVSAGTTNPELAYALTEYLTRQPEVPGQFFGTLPARQNMAGINPEDGPFEMPEISPEVQALQQEAMAHALPLSELRYAGYLNVAVGMLSDDGQSPDTRGVLNAVEEQARLALQTASARREAMVLVVATPVPTPALSSEQMALKFGVLNLSPLPNETLWEQAVTEFAASDPEVGYVELVTDLMGTGKPYETYDCYYVPYNALSMTGTNGLLNLDPLLNADPNFDPGDMIGGVLDQFRFDNAIWAYPLTLHPLVLWVDPEAFMQAGVPIPNADWSIQDFTQALTQLKSASPENAVPFVPGSSNNIYLQLLIAAYGGTPFDFRVDPPTVNLTAPETVEAIRQVLDLARDGYIAYRQLDNSMGGGGGGTPPISTGTLSTTSWQVAVRHATGLSIQLAMYPRSSQLVPVSYSLGVAYISARTSNPAACYRWIRHLAQRPELFTGMPVSYAELESSSLVAALGSDIVEFFRQYATILDAPNRYVVPVMTDYRRLIEEIWLNRALNRIVLEHGDLETELEEAQTFIVEFRTCTADILPLDSNIPEEERGTHFTQYTDCAIKIDPSLESRFGSGG